MLISKFFDAVSDIMMGHIEEKFAKPGAKARPWIKRMVIPYALSAIILFAVPNFTSTVAQAFMYLSLTICSVRFTQCCDTLQLSPSLDYTE